VSTELFSVWKSLISIIESLHFWRDQMDCKIILICTLITLDFKIGLWNQTCNVNIALESVWKKENDCNDVRSSDPFPRGLDHYEGHEICLHLLRQCRHRHPGVIQLKTICSFVTCAQNKYLGKIDYDEDKYILSFDSFWLRGTSVQLAYTILKNRLIIDMHHLPCLSD